MSMNIASLIPGRVAGFVETDPRQSAADRILLLKQTQLAVPDTLPAGIIIVDPAPFSHTVIRWCGQGVPAGMLTADQAARLTRGDPIVLDTACGHIRPWDAAAPPPPWEAPPPAGQPQSLRDGHTIELRASIGACQNGQRARQNGATAIGLVRTEYLLPPGKKPPTQEFYQAIFGECLEAAANLPVNFRLLDLAADKWPDWLPPDPEADAWRGLRGSQWYHYPPLRELIKAQLQALARLARRDDASPLGLIWPAGGSLANYQAWQRQLAPDLSDSVSWGAMIETPLEALAIDNWLQAADFVALGCNDLMQHLGGASRDDPRLRHLLDPCQPSLYRFYREVARKANGELARVQLCGLLPQIDGVLPVLIGLGFRNFSVEPALIPLLARQAEKHDLATCRKRADAVCAASDSTAVRRLLGVPPSPLWGLVHAPASDCEPSTDR